MYEVYTENGLEEVNLCQSYYEEYLQGKGTNGLWTLFCTYIGYFIIGVNFACRTLFIKLALLIGYTSETRQTEFIKYGIFMVYFCNMSLLYIVAPWDSREVDSPVINGVFQGVYTDYNMPWF